MRGTAPLSAGSVPAARKPPRPKAPAPRGGQQAAVALRHVTKVFPNGRHALQATSVIVEAGELVSIIGPSACGKTTLLRNIAGLTPATSGAVATPEAPSRAFVFQEATLLPWRSVRKNAELLLELEGIPKAERRRRAANALELVGLTGFEQSYPRELSGGMKMRLSLARALGLRPRLFLMDEPFSGLDEITREALNDELLAIWRSERFTTIFVTHSVHEAVYLSGRVLVFSARPGRVVADIDVPFPYPRNPELRVRPEFNALAGQVSAALRGAKDR